MTRFQVQRYERPQYDTTTVNKEVTAVVNVTFALQS
jgi:hypothetical protein